MRKSRAYRYQLRVSVFENMESVETVEFFGKKSQKQSGVVAELDSVILFSPGFFLNYYFNLFLLLLFQEKNGPNFDLYYKLFFIF